MRTLTLLFLLLLSQGSLKANASRNDNDKPGVEVSCILLENDIRLSHYTVILYRDGVVSDTFTVSKARPLYFILDYGHQYAVRHMAEGYRDRVVMIDTHVSKETAAEYHTFDYQVEMIPADQPANTICDLPAAVVRYDAKLETFDYSKTYSKQVRVKPGQTTVSR